MPATTPRQPKDGIYLAILWVLGVSTALGAALLVAGATLLAAESLVILGAGITAICGSLLLFFRRLGRRRAARTSQSGASDEAVRRPR